MVMVAAMVGAIAAAEVITMDGGGAEAIITDGGTIIAVGGDYKSTGSRVTIR
jgi:predicted amidohydrolase YtcJ